MGVRLVDNTEKVIAALNAQVAEGINEAINYWTDEAKANANVDTGFMREHIGMTKAASPADLYGMVRSLAPYSGPQDTGRNGNLFWTRAFLATRNVFKQFLYRKGASAGGGVIKAAQMDYHGPMGRKGQGF